MLRPAGTSRSVGATDGAVLGTTGTPTAALASRLFTITQRM
jgi:hypothetical protein